MHARAAPFALLAVAAAALAPGCLGGDDPTLSTGEYRIVGTLAADASEAQIEELRAVVRSHDGELQLDPDGRTFIAGPFGDARCRGAFEQIAQKPYVTHASECEPVQG